MAITKLSNGKHQVKVVGSDGKWVTRCFISPREAAKFEGKLKQHKNSGGVLLSENQSITLDEYFAEWYAGREGQDGFKDHPKGRRQHTNRLPHELIEVLKIEKEKSSCPFIATVDGVNMLSYEWYCRRLKRNSFQKVSKISDFTDFGKMRRQSK